MLECEHGRNARMRLRVCLLVSMQLERTEQMLINWSFVFCTTIARIERFGCDTHYSEK